MTDIAVASSNTALAVGHLFLITFLSYLYHFAPEYINQQPMDDESTI